MFVTHCNAKGVDLRLDKALSIAFGDILVEPNVLSAKGETYKPQYYAPRRTARCPCCGTVARHLVERKASIKGSGSLLECIWCFSLFSTRGNCR